MNALSYLLIAWVVAIGVCVNICRMRNRSMVKGALLGIAGNWIAAFCLWYLLKRRSKKSGTLY